MGPSVATAAAFAASGAAWLAGFALSHQGSLELSSFFVVAGGYVVLGSLLLGVRSDRLVSTLTVLWGAAVGIFGALLSAGDPAVFNLLLALAVSLMYGSAAFVAWVAFGLIGLRLLGHLPDPAPAAFRHEP
jgi:hypothetical protein